MRDNWGDLKPNWNKESQDFFVAHCHGLSIWSSTSAGFMRTLTSQILKKLKGAFIIIDLTDCCIYVGSSNYGFVI
jgi:hypothetical protein